MTSKNAASFAFIGTLLLSLLLLADFVTALLGVMRDIVPAMALLRSLVYLIASISVAFYFFVSMKDR